MTCRGCGKDTAASDSRIAGELTEREHTCPHGRKCSGPSRTPLCPECPKVTRAQAVESGGYTLDPAAIFSRAGFEVYAGTALNGDGAGYPMLRFKVMGLRFHLDVYEVEALRRALDAWTSGLHSAARVEGTRKAARGGS
jgi:hypothetical protein